MRTRKLIVCILAGLFIMMLASCQDEKQADDFSGVGRLIAGRNKARYDKADDPTTEKEYTSKQKTANQKDVVQSASKYKDLSTITLYEEKVNILASESGRTLAKGVAYLNKKGEIVKIKILKK